MTWNVRDELEWRGKRIKVGPTREELCTDPSMSYMSNLAPFLLARSREFQAQKDYKLQVYS